MNGAVEILRETYVEQLQQSWRAFCATRSEETFAGVYENCQRYAFTICYRILGDEESALDATQVVFTDLLEVAQAAGAADIPDVNGLVRQLALKNAGTIMKQRQRHRARHVEDADNVLQAIEEEATNPRADLTQRQIETMVRSEVESLPEEIRVPLKLYYEQGLTQREIAEELSVSRTAITGRIKEGQTLLESRLRRLGIDQPLILLASVFAISALTRSATAVNASAVYQKAMAVVEMKSAAAVPTAVVVKSPGFGKLEGLRSARHFALLGAAAAIVAAVAVSKFVPALQPSATGKPQSSPSTQAARTSTRAAVRVAAVAEPIVVPPTPVQVAPAEGTGVLHGRVLSHYTGDPVPGIRLEIPDLQTSSTSVDRLFASATVSDANGYFSFASVPAGTYRVLVDSDAPWADGETTASVIAQPGNPEIKVPLYRIGTVLGRLINEAGEPLVDEPVSLASNAAGFEKKARTDADGRFRFDALTIPFYGVSIRGHSHYHGIVIPESGVRELTWSVGEHEIAGSVTRAGLPATSATVRAVRLKGDEIIGNSSTVAADGTFSVNGLTGETWVVEVYPRDKQLAAQSVTRRVQIQEGNTQLLNIELPSGRVSGVVLDAAGAPVAGARIGAVLNGSDRTTAAVPPRLLATSEADGTFSLEGYAPGEYTVFSQLKNGSLVVASKVVIPEEGESAALSLQPFAEPTGQLEVTVLSSAHGEELSSGWIEIRGAIGRLAFGQVDGSKRLTVSGLPPGEYEILSTSAGHSVSRQTSTIAAAQMAQIAAVVNPAGALDWRIIADAGEEIIGAHCRMEPLDPNSMEQPRAGQLDAKGQWKVRGILPGDYLLSAKLGGITITDEVRIDAHDQRTIITHADKARLAAR